MGEGELGLGGTQAGVAQSGAGAWKKVRSRNEQGGHV